MDTSNLPQHQKITVGDLYPDLDKEQLTIAEENLERYLELSLQIYDRILQDPEECARFKTLTASARDRYDVEGQRSNYKSRT